MHIPTPASENTRLPHLGRGHTYGDSPLTPGILHLGHIGKLEHKISQLMRLWYLSHRQPAKVQASLRIRAVSQESLLFAHMKYGSR